MVIVQLIGWLPVRIEICHNFIHRAVRFEVIPILLFEKQCARLIYYLLAVVGNVVDQQEICHCQYMYT